jgi:AcrR family transcriptional regulator
VDPARRRAVLVAAGELLREEPYDEVTIDRIAARAGVGRQLLYRAWGSKAEVVAQAVLQGTFEVGPQPVPETDDLRADLEHWLRATAEALSSEQVRSLARSLAAASAGGPDRRDLFDEVLTRRATAVVVARLQREKDPAVPRERAEVIAELLIGFLTLGTLGSTSLEVERLSLALDAVLPPSQE